MDITPVTSSPSISVQNFNRKHESQRSASKSAAMPFQRIREPMSMSIPNSRGEPPPPPLPPPTHMANITAGSDPGHFWANKFSGGSLGTRGGSIYSESSLPRGWDQKIEEDGDAERMDYSRRGSSQSRIKPPPELDTKYDFSRQNDEGYYSLSGPSPANYQLRSVKYLERQNHENSAQAYDNKLLSKIGKPTTPPRTLTANSVDASPTSSMPFYQNGKQPHPLKSLSVSDASTKSSLDFPFRKDSFPSRFGDSPQSRPISPGLISAAASAKSYMDYRSPTMESSTPSSATDSECQQRRLSTHRVLRHQRSRRSGSGPSTSASTCTSISNSQMDESATASVPTKPNTANVNTSSEYISRFRRGSCDQPMFSEPDSASISDVPMEETGNTAIALRHLRLEDRPPPSSLDSSVPSSYYLSSTNSSASDSRLGMKRRASSPPPEAAHDEKAPSLLVGNSSELYQRNTTPSTAHLSANRSSPQNRFPPTHGSVSSTSSTSFRNGSYASSNGLSVGSSITSISSHDRLSPGGISPSSDQQQQHNGRDSPYVTSLSMNPAPPHPLSRPSQPHPSETKSSAAIARKMSTGNPAPRKQNAPNIQPHAHICECCPKKPKKFDTLQELRSHESEKQYQCQFCHNRFKNKNEAERHQNSLHLRRHSWSCATLAINYDAAFHLQTQIPNNTPNDPSPPMNAIPDICGYCGEEFSNDPTPDWEARMAHLQNVHKFGECNQSKKFFRADHFRQHLKHSHAGTSGKWTNMLENACMKDEPPLTGPGQGPDNMQPQGAPVAHMGGMGGMGLAPGPGSTHGMIVPGMGGLRDDRIEETHEEI